MGAQGCYDVIKASSQAPGTLALFAAVGAAFLLQSVSQLLSCTAVDCHSILSSVSRKTPMLPVHCQQTKPRTLVNS